jgi:DNA polymerase I
MSIVSHSLAEVFQSSRIAISLVDYQLECVFLNPDDIITTAQFSGANILTELVNILKSYSGTVYVLNRKALTKQLELYSLHVNYTMLDVSLARYLSNSSQSMDSYYVPLATDELYTEAQGYENTFSPDMLKLWKDIESPLATVLGNMEKIGVFVDKSKLKQTAATMQKQLNELTETIHTFLGSQININSPQQLGKALILQGFILKQSKTGNVSTSKEVLDQLLVDDDSGLIQAILDYRTINKLLGTYTLNLIELLDGHDRIHCTFNQAQAATGRLSSAEPNLQNIPIRNQEFGTLIRSCFAAPQGRMIVSADYSQIELRLLAHLSGDVRLIEAFNDDQDIHSRTAAEMLQIPLDTVSKEQRTLGKTLNFALVYQQGAFATSKMLGITQKEAKEFTTRYFEAFPGIKPFVDTVVNGAKETGYVESLLGRRRYFQNLNSKMFMLRQMDERAAFNAVLQGSNADLIKVAMLDIYRQIEEQGVDARIILQVHDELVFEVAENDVEKLSAIVTRCMSQSPVPLSVPIKVDIHVGQNWTKE